LPIPVVSLTLKSSRNKTITNVESVFVPRIRFRVPRLNNTRIARSAYIVEKENYRHSLVVTVKFRRNVPELLFRNTLLKMAFWSVFQFCPKAWLRILANIIAITTNQNANSCNNVIFTQWK
jgi:hypothetical protein